MTTLSRFADRGIPLMADMVVRPAFTEGDFMRVRQLRLHRLTQLRDMPGAVADRTFVRLLYGDHPYGHTPMGSELVLATGEAFDVKVQPVVEKREKLGEYRWRTTMRYDISNAKPEAVNVDLTQAGLDWVNSDTRIVSESQPSKRRNSDSTVWAVAVPANGRTTVNAVFDTRY